jgi:hypothetical protein
MADEQKPDDSPSVTPESPETTPESSAFQSRPLSASAKIADLTIGDLNSIIASETAKAIASRLGNAGNIGAAGSHVIRGRQGSSMAEVMPISLPEPVGWERGQIFLIWEELGSTSIPALPDS